MTQNVCLGSATGVIVIMSTAKGMNPPCKNEGIMKEFWMAGMGGWEGGWVGAWVGGWFSEWLSEKLSWWVVEQVSKQEIKQGGFREVGREDYRVS